MDSGTSSAARAPSAMAFPSIDEMASSPTMDSFAPLPMMPPPSQPWATYPTGPVTMAIPPNANMAMPTNANTETGYYFASYDSRPEPTTVPEMDNVGYDEPTPFQEWSETDLPQIPTDHATRPATMSRWDGHRWLRFKHRFGRRYGSDFGLGFERVMFAPMAIDTAISSPYMGIRFRSDRGLSSPDRLEYLWAKAGRGPAPETRVDLLDSVYRTELGNSQAAFISEIAMRSLNPEVNANTVGFGDMVVGGKAIVYDGQCTKISSIFLSYLNTGPTNRGLGTGHVSLEPGMLIRHQWSNATYLHGEVKYRLPIAGSPGFAGDVLSTGWGISTVWRDSDQFAVIPTLEVLTHSFLFGEQTLSNGTVQRIDGATAVDFFPGVRFAFARSNMGLWEWGIAGGGTLADRDWFDSRMVLDIRLVR